MKKFTNQSVPNNSNIPLFNPNPNHNYDSIHRSNSSKKFDDWLNSVGYVHYNAAGYTTSELRELKKRLTSELDQIRILRERIESETFETQQVYTTPEVSFIRSAPTNSFTGETNDFGLKKIKEPKNWSVLKQCNPFDAEESHLKRPAVSDQEKLLAGMFKTCRQILVKLMKHKWAWVFNTPVDVVGLRLYDYHLIVKKPMNLGSVKLNLEKGFYVSPLDFAADVRLTFNNAMMFNPKGHDVNFMAEKLLDDFNGKFIPAFEKFEIQQLKLTGSSSHPKPEFKQRQWNQTQMAVNARRGTEQISISKSLHSVKPTLPRQLSDLPPVQTPSLSPPPHPAAQQQSRVQQPVSEVAKGSERKLPKPKAKDQNKRLMTMEEKSKLGMNLANLPHEKFGQFVQILRNRNEHLAQVGDEIEVDIQALDNETLWEVDRFVTNYKMASKIKRQGLIQSISTTTPITMTSVTEMGNAEKICKVEAEEEDVDIEDEDVDIGEDLPMENYPSIEIERDVTAEVVAASSESSSLESSSSSSCSSCRESGSGGRSSDSDQSPFVEAEEAQ